MNSKNIAKFMKKNSSNILSILGCIGVAATGYLTVKATIKAVRMYDEQQEDIKEVTEKYNYDEEDKEELEEESKKEFVKEVLPCCAPPVLAGLTTVVCVLSANVLNRKQIASLTGAGVMAASSFKQYRQQVIDKYGIDDDKKFRENIKTEDAKDIVISANDNLWSYSLDVGNYEDLEAVHTFYDDFSDRYFKSSLSKVIQAMYHFNRNYQLLDWICINDYYSFLGLDEVERCDNYGWNHEDGLVWIDFDITVRIDKDTSEPIYVIDLVIPPDDDYMAYISTSDYA